MLPGPNGSRDAERAELSAQRARTSESDELRTADSYCGDQWTFGVWVMAFEYFETNTAGPLLLYRFLIGKNGGEQGANGSRSRRRQASTGEATGL